MRSVLLALALLAALPARAETQLDGNAFEKFVEGWTLHFELNGQVYGAEQYLPGRRSLWRFGEEGCEKGIWWEEAGAICFRYENAPDPQCWIVTEDGGSLTVRMVDDPEGLGALRMSRKDKVPLDCPGPDVGV